MPKDLDSASVNPAETQPQAGPGSQTPKSPIPTQTPVGATPAVKPNGAPGAPAKPQPQQQQGQSSNQDDLNRYKAIQQTLYPDIVAAITNVLEIDTVDGVSIESLTVDQINKIKDYLLDIGWDATHLFNDIFKTNDLVKIKDFISTIFTYQNKINETDKKQLENTILQKELQTNIQSEILKKQEAELLKKLVTTVQPPLGEAPIGAPAPASPMPPMGENNLIRGASMKTLTVAGGKIVTASSDSDSVQSSPDILALLFATTKEASACISKYDEALLMLEGAKSIQDAERIASFEDVTTRLGDKAKSKLAELQDKLAEANVAKQDAKDIETDKKFDDAIGKGEGVFRKGSDLFKSKDKEPTKVSDDKPKEDPKKDEAPKSSEGEDKTKKETVAAASLDASKVAEIKSSVFKKVLAQLMPAKDLCKQTQSAINSQSAKSNISAAGKVLNDVKKEKTEGLLGMNKDKNLNPAPSTKEIERVKKSTYDITVAKAKIAFEVAGMQQLKGLMDNPLKDAIVSQAKKAGLSDETAYAVAHNAFIDGYQKSMELVASEALGTLIKKSDVEFKEISEATKTAAPVDSSKTITAGVKGK